MKIRIDQDKAIVRFKNPLEREIFYRHLLDWKESIQGLEIRIVRRD